MTSVSVSSAARASTHVGQDCRQIRRSWPVRSHSSAAMNTARGSKRTERARARSVDFVAAWRPVALAVFWGLCVESDEPALDRDALAPGVGIGSTCHTRKRDSGDDEELELDRKERRRANGHRSQ